MAAADISSFLLFYLSFFYCLFFDFQIDSHAHFSTNSETTKQFLEQKYQGGVSNHGKTRHSRAASSGGKKSGLFQARSFAFTTNCKLRAEIFF